MCGRVAHSHTCTFKHVTRTHYIVVVRKDGRRNGFGHVTFQHTKLNAFMCPYVLQWFCSQLDHCLIHLHTVCATECIKRFIKAHFKPVKWIVLWNKIYNNICQIRVSRVMPYKDIQNLQFTFNFFCFNRAFNIARSVIINTSKYPSVYSNK